MDYGIIELPAEEASTFSPKQPFQFEDFPEEILENILLKTDIASLESVLKVSQRWRALAMRTIPKVLSKSQIIIDVTQEDHWFMKAKMSYTGFNPITQQVTYQVLNGSGIKLYRFFYALLVSKPRTSQVKIAFGDSEYLVRLERPIRLDTKNKGIKVSSPVDSQCALLYTIETNEDLGVINPNHDSPGVRWITPLSFQCSLSFFSSALPLHQAELVKRPPRLSYFIKSVKDILNLSPPSLPAPSMLSPRISASRNDKLIKPKNRSSSRPPRILSV